MNYESILTTCPYCGAGCNLFLQVIDGAIVGVLPSKTDIISQGKLCVKGWNAHDFIYHPDRLQHPLVKKNGKFRKAAWKEALALVSDRLEATKKEHGSDSLALLSSAKCTNEENYLLQKFARSVIGTNNIDHCARL